MPDKDPRFVYQMAVYDYKGMPKYGPGQFVGLLKDITKDGKVIGVDMDEQMWISTAPGTHAIVRRYQVREIAFPAWLPAFFWPDFCNNAGVRIVAWALMESPKRQSLPKFKADLRQSFITNGRLTDGQLSALFKWSPEGRRYFKLDKNEEK